MTHDLDPRCQARPAAARPAYRVDMLCASAASSEVSFAGAEMPVCRMHEETYVRWGANAETNARERWDWH